MKTTEMIYANHDIPLGSYTDNSNSEHDPVNNPDHYTKGGIETLDFMKAKLSKEQYEGYLLGNIIKYLSRSEYKGKKLEDLKKAQFYMNELVKQNDE